MRICFCLYFSEVVLTLIATQIISLGYGNKTEAFKNGNASKVLIRLKIKNVNSIGENKMPMIIFGVIRTMAIGYLGNSKIMEQTCLLCLKYLSSLSSNKVDDKLVALLEKSINQKKD